MTVGEIVYKITGDDSGLKTSLKKTETNANNAAGAVGNVAEAYKALDESIAKEKSELEAIDSAMKQAGNSAVLYSQKNELLKKTIIDLKSRLNLLVSQQEEMTSALKSGDISIEQYREWQREIETTRGEIKKLTEQQEHLYDKTNKTSKAFESIGSAAKSALGTAAKASAAVTAAAAAAVTALAKSAIDGYAEYEQLVGGVETLFNSSADIVKGYADNAYKTAGMSANAYMETVTGFSASLLQGLGGDTAKAAEIANQAVIDMSDNANKMGTDMTMIQNAYQGFAKQNYTMLDNLKLGYGGTQAEMARLINDSGVMGDAMTVTAETVNSVSFDKIIEAIHVIQTDMGITGTTAEEAATTIQGSIVSMQAAWENCMVGIADPTQDFDALLGNLIESVLTVSDNLMPRIMAVLPQMAEGVSELAENILPLVPETLEKMLPSVLEGANALISALMDVLSSVADTAIPVVTENAGEIIDTLLSGLMDAAPKLAASAVDLCTELITAILENADIITQGAADVIAALVKGIGENLDKLIPAAVDAVAVICSGLIENISMFQDASNKLIDGLGKGIGDAVPKLLVSVGDLIIQLVAEIIAHADEMESPGIILAKGLIEGMKKGIEDLAIGMDGPVGALKKALDNIFTGGAVYNQTTAEDISAGAGISELQDSLWDEAEGIEEAAVEYGEMSKSAAEFMAENARKNAEAIKKAEQKAADDALSAQKEKWEAVEASLNDLDSELAKHKMTEGDYWSERKALLEANRDEESAEWWKYYDKVTEYYEKLSETEAKAAEKAAKERESALKKSVEDKFGELETEQLENGYSDTWLLEQQRAFIETLDHNSELYKDYNLKLLKEQKSTDDKAAKEAEDAAKKTADTLEKSYESVVKARDSLADSISLGGDIFKSTEETDKRSGEKKKSGGIDTSEYKRKLEAKKKLTGKIAELYEKEAPDSLVRALLKKDPEEALAEANQLLRDSKKLSEIKSMFKEDKQVSDALANIVTENSSEFEQLGTDAGAVFGESFISAFRENWEAAFSSVFGDEEYKAKAAVQIRAANSMAAESTSVRRDYTAGATVPAGGSKRSFDAQQQDIRVRVLDINGTWLADAVEKASDQKKTTSGG